MAAGYKRSFLESIALAPIPIPIPNDDDDSSLTTDLVEFLRQSIFKASSEAIFGPEFPSAEIFKYYTEFELCVPDLLKGYPRFMCSKGYQTRDKVLSILEKFISDPNVSRSVSPVVQMHLETFENEGKKYNTPYAKARYLLGILFASTVSI